MDCRDQLHGKTIQDSWLNQHGCFPVAGLPGLQSFEPPSMAMMEHMAAPHDADTQNLLIRNQQLLEHHQTLRQDLGNTEKVIQTIRDDLGAFEVLSGLHMNDLVEKIRKMEAEICAGAAVKKELLEVHFEADKLRAEKQELSVKLQELTDRIKIIEKCCDGKACFPELRAELDRLQEKYQSARAVLQYSRDINKKQVEKMKTMEMSLKAMTEQVNNLCVELQDAEIRAQELAMVVQAIADDTGIAETQTMPAGIGSHGSANNNVPSAYHQFGVAQDPSASAAVYPYESLYVYLPAASYQQATEGWLYGYNVPYEDTNPMVYHLPVQASGYAGYSDADYDENVIFLCPVYTAVNGAPAADAAGMDGNAGSPSLQDETDGDTTVSLAETSETSSDTLSLVTLTLTEEDRM